MAKLYVLASFCFDMHYMYGCMLSYVGDESPFVIVFALTLLVSMFLLPFQVDII